MTATISEEYEKDGIVFRKTHFTGRRTSSGTVNIFALAAFDKNNTLMPAVLILPNYSKGVDEATVELFARRGYFAFMVDYGGNGKDGERTEYPEDISYAHYTGDEECIHRIETDAKETCWYEWCAVGRYALYYLSKHKRVSCTGGFGIKHGATVMWQLAASGQLSCAVTMFSSGWREYRGFFKFGGEEPDPSDEMYRYLAAIEPQSYAQYVSCPLLMLTTTNNAYFDVDRTYDTVQRIDKSIERFVNYSVQCNKYLDRDAYKDVFIFFRKELYGEDIVLPGELEISAKTEDGYIYVTVNPDKNELRKVDLYASEETLNPALRCWNFAAEQVEETKEGFVCRYLPYKYSGQVFFFATAKYTSGFSVSSRIICKKFDESEIQNESKSNIIFSSRENKYLLQPYFRRTDSIIAYMREKATQEIRIERGAFDIEGITCAEGLRSLKINNKKDRPKEGSILLVDIYAPDGGDFKVSLTEGVLKDEVVYSATANVSGGEVWHKCSFNLNKFKTAEGLVVRDISRINSIIFEFEGKYLLNNILWV